MRSKEEIRPEGKELQWKESFFDGHIRKVKAKECEEEDC